MAWTKATYLSRMRTWMDATGSDRWSDTFLYSLLGMKFRDEWQGILDASPYYRFAQRSVTTDANGRFTLALLSSGSGDSQENLYKIVTVTDGQNVVYRETEFMREPLAAQGTQSAYDWQKRYYLRGSDVQVLPPAQGTGLVVTVNWFPTPIDELSGDGINADFPAGNENLVAIAAAAEALAIGGAETQATGDLMTLAQKYRESLLVEVTRRTTTPTFLGFSDNAADWGG